MIAVVVERSRRCHSRVDQWRRRRRIDRLDVQRDGRVTPVMVAGVAGIRSMVPRLCLSRCMIAMTLSRCNANSRRQRDNGDRADKHRRACKRRNRFPLQSAIPDPRSAHHDIDLQQQSAQIGGLHHLGLTRMRTKRGARGPGQNPQCDSTHVEPDTSGQHRRRGSDQNYTRPNQLEECERSKEYPGQRPFLPVRGHDAEMDESRPQGGQRGTTSSQPTVGLRRRLDCHPSDDCSTTCAASHPISHLNPTDILLSRNVFGV